MPERVAGWTMTGRPLDWFQATMLFADTAYRRVAETWLYIPDSAVEFRVSTMFMVHVTGRHKTVMPKLFETMIFRDGDFIRGHGILSSIFGFKIKTMTIEAAFDAHAAVVDTIRGQGGRLALPIPENGCGVPEQSDRFLPSS